MVRIAAIHAILLDLPIFIELLYVELTSGNISDPRAAVIDQRMIIGH